MSDQLEFQSFPKIARLSREVVVTEKIDGTNAQIIIGENGEFLTAKRSGLCTPENDNFGFSAWAHANKDELMKLGPGRHFGEWWGVGIQRGYGLHERRFSLFNTKRWNEETKPKCCHVVPVIDRCIFGDGDEVISRLMDRLHLNGSYAAPGFMKPEGIIVFHTASSTFYKKTFEKDDYGKEAA